VNSTKFLLISPKQIYTLDEKQMIINPLKLFININYCWERGTCSEISLYLSTFGDNPYIVQFYLNPSIQFNQYDIINDIKYHDNHLAIIIENGLYNQSHFQFHSLKSFQCIWKVLLGQGWSYRSSLFNQRYWIISDSCNNRIIHILNDGIIIKIDN